MRNNHTVPTPAERPDLPYLILHGATAAALAQEVISYRKAGWALCGGVAVGPNVHGGVGLNFYQAVAAPDALKL